MLPLAAGAIAALLLVILSAAVAVDPYTDRPPRKLMMLMGCALLIGALLGIIASASRW